MNVNTLAESLTGRELITIEDTTGQSLDKLQEGSATKLLYVLAWIGKRREDSNVTWDDVLDLPLLEVSEYLGVNEAVTDDPKA